MTTTTPTIPTSGVTSAMTRIGAMKSDWIWGALGACLMSAYWPGIAGVATTPRWNVAATVAVMFFMAPRTRLTAVHWWGMIVFCWLIATLSWESGDAWLDGVNETFQLVVIGCAFVVGSHAVSMRAFLLGCGIGIGINSAVAVAQECGWQALPLYNQHLAGLFYNPDQLAAPAAMVALGVMADRRLWWLLPLTAPSLVLVHSSAAWLALAVGVFILAGRLPHGFRETSRALMISAGCAAVFLKVGSSSADERLAIWRDTLHQLSFWGHGLGSFREGFLAHATSYDFVRFNSRPEHPHNEGLWLVYEGGIFAVIAACGLVVCLIRRGRQASAFTVLAAFAVLCLFAMPLHDPATAVMAAVVAGHCAAVCGRNGGGDVDCGLPLRTRLAADDDPTEHGPFSDRPKGFSIPTPIS